MNIAGFFIHSPRRALLLALGVASAGILAAALVAQYGFGLHPCELCLYQRYPYVAIMFFSLAALVPSLPFRVLHYVAFLCIGLLLLDGGIAVYHAGVETGLFPAPGACSSNTSPGETIEEMRRAIMNAALVPCDQPMAHILGLSMAAWNAIAAFVLAGAALVALRKTA